MRPGCAPRYPGRRPWDRLPARRRRARAAGGWLAAALAAGGLALAGGALLADGAPPAPAGGKPPAGTPVLVAARDLPAGARPAPGALRPVRLPPVAVPADALAVPPGRPLALALRRGDVLTRRHLGEGEPAAGLRAYALPLGEGVEAGPLVPGDRVDVVAASAAGAETVLRDAPVLRLVPPDAGTPARVVLGVTARQAEALAAARARAALTLLGVAGPPPPVG